MAAVKLVTRCPACRTAFRLVADQLRLRQGLVRCGHCETVFDAREHLIEIPLPAGGATPAAAAPVSSAAPARAASAPASAGAAPAPMPASAPLAPLTPQTPQTPFKPTIDPGYDVPALDAPTMMMSPEEMDAQADASAAAPAQAGMDDDEIERAVREANEAVAQRDARDAERQAAAPTEEPAQPPAAVGVGAEVEPEAESEAEPEAEAEVEPEVKAEADLELEPEAGADAAPASATPAGPNHAEDTPAQPASVAVPWPTLDHAALDMAEPAAEKPAASEPQAATDKPAPSPAAPAAAIPSASEFLRAASADAAPAPSAQELSFTPASADRFDDAGEEAGAQDLAPDTGSQPSTVTGGAVAREQTTRRWARTEAPAGPVFAPDFLRHARERERERTREPRRGTRVPRYAWHAAAVVLALAGAVQAAYLARGQLAGQFPMLRPVLEAACAPLGCDVPPWRDIDALRIESSQLQRQDESGDVYLLTVTLRNQGRASTVLPAIELVMTDLQDQLLLRRVLQPADYLDPTQKAFAAQGLRAGMELPVRVRFRTQQAPANYRVLIFYP
ncbi:zinc-ribbon and DUF3426 domain-containing protein [Cupriavidus sp. DF5525]|uniref:zinc-ribbon and DUF3426 domain-containing protein n=1 Tax=Cupriavidus sp. DF5525 TaxID=3160989 RepID=UPI0003B06555|nr:hypothetical protein N234_18025 [Ralstonia pickettii DTP0602]